MSNKQLVKEYQKMLGKRRIPLDKMVIFNERKCQIHDIVKVCKDELGLSGMQVCDVVKGEQK